MYPMVRDKKSIWTICILYNPFSATQFQTLMLWEHRQQEDKQVLGGTLRPLHLVQEVLQQFENCTRVAENKPVETEHDRLAPKACEL